MDLVTWLIVGLVAGVLAALLVGGVGLIGDIIVGIAGAFVGGWIFGELGVRTPFRGLAGTIFTAFVGAVVLLFLFHLISGRRRRRVRSERPEDTASRGSGRPARAWACEVARSGIEG